MNTTALRELNLKHVAVFSIFLAPNTDCDFANSFSSFTFIEMSRTGIFG